MYTDGDEAEKIVDSIKLRCKTIHEWKEDCEILMAHMITVREEEKIHFAREIHDEFGGALTAITMEAYRLAEKLSANENTTQLCKHAELMGNLVDNAIDAMRRIINNLRPAMLDELGLRVSLECYIAQFSMSTGIKCQLDYMLDNDDEKNVRYAVNSPIPNHARNPYKCEEAFPCIKGGGRGIW